MNGFVHNWILPTLIALAAAVITAVEANLPGVLADGFQTQDVVQLAGVAASAALGFVATLLTRYAGKREAWILPAKQPNQVVSTEAGAQPH